MAARMLLVKKIILVLLMLILGTGTCFAQTAGRNFLLYDLQMCYGGTFPLVTSLAEHLGHFEEDYVLIAVDDWQPGLLQDADTIVYAGLQQRKLPRELVEEIAGARQVLWFEDNIEQLAEVKGWHDFRSLGKVSDWIYINFKGRSFYDWMSVEYTDPGKNVNVIATAKKFIDEVPVIWQRENIYYSGMLEFNELFDDYMGYLLHQVFKRHTDDQRPKAFLRVEDVSPIVDPKAVKAVVEKIEKYNIPFAIGVVPVGIMDGKKHYLHEREELVEVLQEAQKRGASIIMHGYTHQNEFSPTTGEGYEFWNAKDDRPMEDEESFTVPRIEAGISELLRCGLIPLAFEAPHYAASQKTYEILSRYFNIYSGQLQISDDTDSVTMTLPYMTRSRYLYGMLVIPENMGFYDGGEFVVEEMMNKSASLKTIPGAVACFFYHGYLKPDKVGSIIEGLQKQGYEFLDLKYLPVKVQAPGIVITAADGVVNAVVAEEVKQSWQTVAGEQYLKINKIVSVQAAVLVVILTVFVYIILKLKRNTKKHYEK